MCKRTVALFSDKDIGKIVDELKKIAEQRAYLEMDSMVETAMNLAIDGLFCDGGHHKQWYLEEILKALNFDLADIAEGEDVEWEAGIAP